MAFIVALACSPSWPYSYAMRALAYVGLTLNFPGYNTSKPLNQLKTQLDEYYFGQHHQPHQWFLTSNGRSAMYVFLKSLNLQAGSEVIVQSFTCVSAISPIVWAGLTPIYADIDPNNLSASPESIKQCITPRTKVIILQHTFGLAGAVSQVQQLAKEHGLIVVEDCAHALGTKHGSQHLGTFGDAAIISFGIEKTLSTKFGGALLINNPDLVRPVEAEYRLLPEVSRWQSFLWLLYPGLRQGLRQLPSWLASPLRQGLEATSLLKKAVPKRELQGGKASVPARLPGVHAKVILDSLAGLSQNQAHRQMISGLYSEWLDKNPDLTLLPATDVGYIKFPVICKTAEDRQLIAATLTEQGVHVTDWYRPPIYPAGANYQALGYQPADCPVAESVAERIINLPTGQNVTSRYATMIANVVNAATARQSERA